MNPQPIKTALLIIAGLCACLALKMTLTSYVPWAERAAMHRVLAYAGASIALAVVAATLKPRTRSGFILLGIITGLALFAAKGASAALGWLGP